MTKTDIAREILEDFPEAPLPLLVRRYMGRVPGATYKQAITRLHAARVPLIGRKGKRVRRFVTVPDKSAGADKGD
ncbi:MAG: hypothetical protein WC714_28875 [Candidatus Obscuribacterales bacterium]|jgi:hypothetical protein